MSTLTVGRHAIDLSREDKVLFPQAGYTKRDLVDYYRKAADWILTHAEDRPISMHRYPDGIDGQPFFEKETPGYFPDWIDKAEVTLNNGSRQKQVVINRAATLIYLANQACITPHAWLSRRDKLDRPDRMIFDLDPPDGQNFPLVQEGARRFRDAIDEIGLVPFVQTTGSKGLHVVVPLQRRHGFDEVRDFAHDLSTLLAGRHPDAFTVAHRKDKRKGRLFLDYLRNAHGQTAVIPYSLRGRQGAPVATPLDWDEALRSDMGPQHYTLANIFRRMARKTDPWADLNRHARRLSRPRKALDKLLKDAGQNAS